MKNITKTSCLTTLCKTRKNNCNSLPVIPLYFLHRLRPLHAIQFSSSLRLIFPKPWRLLFFFITFTVHDQNSEVALYGVYFLFSVVQQQQWKFRETFFAESGPTWLPWKTKLFTQILWMHEQLIFYLLFIIEQRLWVFFASY